MSVEQWTYLIVGLSFALYLYIGYRSRVRDTKGFYVAGRGVPPVANGAATAADWMSAASFISMAGLIATLGYDGAIYLLGWTGGYVLLALLLAPYLRKYRKYTVPDFVGDRYASDGARVLAAIATIFISLVYVAGQMRGVGIVFSRFLELEIAQGVLLGVGVVAFFAILGGMKGVTWTQAAQYAVLIIAYLIPAVAIAYLVVGNPVPQLAFAFSDIGERLNRLQTELGFTEYTQPFQSKPMIDVLAIMAALMAGTAGLPHIIIRFYTTPDVRSARYSAFWALVFIGLLYTTAPALAMFARYNLINTLHGKPIEQVLQIDWVAKWNQTGTAQNCGQKWGRSGADSQREGVQGARGQARLQHARLLQSQRGLSGQRYYRAGDAGGGAAGAVCDCVAGSGWAGGGAVHRLWAADCDVECRLA
jgi:cation/acetate symporter